MFSEKKKKKKKFSFKIGKPGHYGLQEGTLGRNFQFCTHGIVIYIFSIYQKSKFFFSSQTIFTQLFTVAYAEICEGGGGFGAENTIALSSPGNGQKLPKLGLHSKKKVLVLRTSCSMNFFLANRKTNY